MGNPFLPLLDSIPFSPPLWKSNLSIWGLLIRLKLRFIKFNCTGCNWQLIIVRAKLGKSFSQTHLQVILCDISVHIFLPFDIVLYVSLTWARESLDSRAWVRGIFFFFILSFLDNVAHDPCKVMCNCAGHHLIVRCYYGLDQLEARTLMRWDRSDSAFFRQVIL